MGLQFLFMDNNALCHRTVAAEQLLESEDIERMDWPARSPDLNPIGHVWDFLGRRLAARTLPPVTIRELRLALQDERAAMPQQLIDTLILSMGRRCETCLAINPNSEQIPGLRNLDNVSPKSPDEKYNKKLKNQIYSCCPVMLHGTSLEISYRFHKSSPSISAHTEIVQYNNVKKTDIFFMVYKTAGDACSHPRVPRAHQTGLSRLFLAGVRLSESVRCPGPGLALLTNGEVQQQQHI
ncbi:transposable element Tcb2 transposase [Trichonephila clavipes]|nr:transposable element Tcb2 transposase [Trichonephila clavipes]